MSYDYRKPLVEALKLLGRIEEELPNSADPLLRSARLALQNAHHHCQVWRHVPKPTWKSADGERLEETFAAVDVLFRQREFEEEGWQTDWTPQAIKNGPRWRELRRLARAAWVPAQGLPRFDPDLKTELPWVGVGTYRESRVPNPPGPEELVEEDGARRLDIHRFDLRAWLLYVSARYGTVRPDDLGPTADFWLVDNVDNDERYHYLECRNPAAPTSRWFREIIETLAAYPGWGLCLTGLPDAYAIIFGDRVLVTGKLSGCRSIDEVARGVPELVGQRSP